jgi:hypothetical protein
VDVYVYLFGSALHAILNHPPKASKPTSQPIDDQRTSSSTAQKQDKIRHERKKDSRTTSSKAVM